MIQFPFYHKVNAVNTFFFCPLSPALTKIHEALENNIFAFKIVASHFSLGPPIPCPFLCTEYVLTIF